MSAYREQALQVGVTPTTVLSDDDPSPHRKLTVTRFSDGTTRFRIGFAKRGAKLMGILAGVWATGTIALGWELGGPLAALLLFVFCGLSPLTIGTFIALTFRFGGEEIVVNPVGLARRKLFRMAPWRRRDRELIDDVVGFDVRADGKRVGLVMRLRSGEVVLAEELGYDAATLAWLARRLQRAMEAARAS
jgi:hypothetical protein